MSVELSKGIFHVSAGLAVFLGVFTYGNVARGDGVDVVGTLDLAVAALSGEAFDSLVGKHLQPTRGQGSGITVNTLAGADDMVLMAGFFEGENQARLIRRDGTLVNSWSLDYVAQFADSTGQTCNVNQALQVDTHGVQLTPEGDLVFNYEYCGTVRLDACNQVEWALAERSHHSLVASERGGFWSLNRRSFRAADHPESYPAYFFATDSDMLHDDTIMRISDTGAIVDEFSVTQLLRENGLEGALTANRQGLRTAGGDELVHTNKVAELSAEQAAHYPMFEAGDLLVSIRNISLVFVVDPDTREIKWSSTGPWLLQHDPEFRDDGLISVFNNNTYRTAYDSNGQTILSTPFTTNILAVDPANGARRVLYGERAGQEMLSVIRGQHQPLADGGILITEFDGGRVFQVDAQGNTVWQYVNAYDEDYVGEVINADIYAGDYLRPGWDSCRAGGA